MSGRALQPQYSSSELFVLRLEDAMRKLHALLRHASAEAVGPHVNLADFELQRRGQNRGEAVR